MIKLNPSRVVITRYIKKIWSAKPTIRKIKSLSSVGDPAKLFLPLNLIFPINESVANSVNIER